MRIPGHHSQYPPRSAESLSPGARGYRGYVRGLDPLSLPDGRGGGGVGLSAPFFFRYHLSKVSSISDTSKAQAFWPHGGYQLHRSGIRQYPLRDEVDDLALASVSLPLDRTASPGISRSIAARNATPRSDHRQAMQDGDADDIRLCARWR
jgi:hypothetical protein